MITWKYTHELHVFKPLHELVNQGSKSKAQGKSALLIFL